MRQLQILEFQRTSYRRGELGNLILQVGQLIAESRPTLHQELGNSIMRVGQLANTSWATPKDRFALLHNFLTAFVFCVETFATFAE